MTTTSSNVTKDYLVVAQNASGRNLHVPVYRFSCNQKGPKVYIQSSIHGAEVQGNVVLHHLFQYLRQADIFGEILLVPNCNPVGSNIKSGEYTLGRFDPVNGQNWNRAYYYDDSEVRSFAETVHKNEDILCVKMRFRERLKERLQQTLDTPWGIGLAQRLNIKLQQLACDADIVLDLHNGPVSTRHIYVPEYAARSAGHFNIPHVILIPNAFAGALDEATFCPWWTLAEILNQRFPARRWDFNVEAFTVEMGSQEVIEFDAGEADATSILTYLTFKGCLKKNTFSPLEMSRTAVYLRNYKTLFSRFGGMVEYVAKPGQHLREGEIMAKVLNVDELDNTDATHCVTAPCDLIPILHFPSASVLGGTQLFKCFTNYFNLQELLGAPERINSVGS